MRHDAHLPTLLKFKRSLFRIDCARIGVHAQLCANALHVGGRDDPGRTDACLMCFEPLGGDEAPHRLGADVERGSGLLQRQFPARDALAFYISCNLMIAAKRSHAHISPGVPATAAQSQAIQSRCDSLIRLYARQLLNQGNDVVADSIAMVSGLVLRKLVLRVIAALPMNGERDEFSVDVDDDLLDDGAKDAFLQRWRAGWVIPHRQQIVAQLQERLTLCVGQLVGLMLLRGGKLAFAQRQLGQRLVPTSLQFLGHQPVLGVNGVVLPAGA